MNEVHLIGRIANDLELRYASSGKAVMNFNLAVQRSFKNNAGEYEADFIRCVVFGKTAEVIAEYIKKGHRIGINGRIQTGSYEKDGKKIFTTDIMVNTFDFIDSVKSDEREERNEKKPNSFVKDKKSAKSEEADPFEENDEIDISDDDLPF